nr:MAG: putative glycoprotein [Wufeng shrew peropuvirus 1]
MFSYLALYFALGPAILGFTGFDCQHHSSSSIYSAIDPPLCTPPSLGWKSIPAPSVSILQIPIADQITVTAVQAKSKRISYYCSYEQHFMPLLYSNNFLDMEPAFLSSPLAETLAHAVLYSEPFRGRILSLDKWDAFHDSKDINADGFCKNWKSSGVLLIKAYKVSTPSAQLVYNPEGRPASVKVWDEIITLSESEVWYSLRDGSMILVPTFDSNPCTLEEIYSGPAEYLVTSLNATFLIVDSISTGLQLGEPTVLCGVPVSKTSSASIIVANQTVPGKTIRQRLTSVHWSAYVHSVVQYEAIHLTKQMSSADQVLSSNVCELERMIYTDILFGAGTDPERTGLRLMGQRGWSVRTAGAGIHVYRCEPVALKVYPQLSCFSRVPVQRANQSSLEFMDPSTLSLYSTAVNISCQDPQNPFFKIRDSWYKLSPDLHQVPPPVSLPSRMSLLNTLELTPLKGLYPQDVLTQSENPLWLQERTDTAHVSLINSVSSDHGQFNSPSPLFDTMTPGFIPPLFHIVSHTGVYIWLTVLSAWVIYVSWKLFHQQHVLRWSPAPVRYGDQL